MFGRSRQPAIPDKAIDAGIRAYLKAISGPCCDRFDDAMAEGEDGFVDRERRAYRAGIAAFLKAWGIGQ